ncbi:MAG: glycosyltransferase family 2 protein [Bacteroidales bacterium]|nr:glycosyltransferase family 2 protein [Bacteroidales bacterium]
MEKPKIIVITPVRNEAWVLDAFLTCTSSWADHIILADHHSEDDTRTIALRYEKVILIDNPTFEWYEAECRARLLEEACKISGDKVIFALDADEFLSDGFEKTESWNYIVNAKGNEIFCFNWLNLYDDFNTVEYTNMHFEWAAHFDATVDVVAEYRKRETRAVHCTRVPCIDEAHYHNVDDFWVVHLAKLNHERNRQKNDFYQVTWVDKNKEKARPVAMYRTCAKFYPDQLTHLDNPVKLCCLGDERDCSCLVRTSDYGRHYVEEMVRVFEREGTRKFAKLCIWDNPYLKDAGVKPKMPWVYKIIHRYLRATQSKSKRLWVKALDKVLNHIL